MEPSPTVIMRRGRRGGRAAMGALLPAVFLGLGALLLSSPAYAAADAKPKPKLSKGKPKYKKAKHKKAKHTKAKPKVKGHVKKRVLLVIGTPKGETIALRLKAGNPNKLQVDVGNNGSPDWQFNRNRFNQLVVLAAGGNDLVLIDEANGVFTDTEATTLNGGPGKDDLRGGTGAELFVGGGENDAVDGNRGNDVAFLGSGDDSFTWDPGDGSDVVEGQAGSDTMLFNGAGVNERFEVSANGPRVRFFRDVATITMDLDDVERIVTQAFGGADSAVVNDMSGTDLKNVDFDLEAAIGGNAGDGQPDSVIVRGTNGSDAIGIAANAGAVDVAGLATAVKIEHSEAANDSLVVEALAGNDTINAGLGLATLIKLTVDGGAGNDTINGGDGADLLLGGSENDSIDGNRGDDVGFLGAGDDSFTWDPGDGSDVVEGQDGADTLRFNGAGVAESFDISANGARVRFFRDVANITMDLDDTERIETQALGGADTAVVNDITGTDLKLVEFDLEAAIGGSAGDGAADSVTVNGTNLADDIDITAIGSVVDVDGPPAEVRIDHSEAANDKLTVNGLGGADNITAGPGLAALIQLVINGGTEVDVLTGGDGNDRIVGQQQNDQMFGGAGNDTLVWNPGDGNDLVEGQAGTDTMEFNGAGVAEVFDLSANGPRLRFTRNIANIVMDVDGTELIDTQALGGADSATVHDLSGTAVTKASFDLEAAIGGNVGDGAADTVIVEGTNGADAIDVAASAGAVDVTGLAAVTSISHSEPANDLLRVNALGGDDDVDVGAGVAALIQVLVDLGSGE
jgi:Ca2+-binding RTX toxin-like protein